MGTTIKIIKSTVKEKNWSEMLPGGGQEEWRTDMTENITFPHIPWWAINIVWWFLTDIINDEFMWNIPKGEIPLLYSICFKNMKIYKITLCQLIFNKPGYFSKWQFYFFLKIFVRVMEIFCFEIKSKNTKCDYGMCSCTWLAFPLPSPAKYILWRYTAPAFICKKGLMLYFL